MNEVYRKLSVRIGSAISNTFQLRQNIAELVNTSNTHSFDTIAALIALSVGHAKQLDVDRNEFLGLCGFLYDSISVTPKGLKEDIIILPEHQNN